MRSPRLKRLLIFVKATANQGMVRSKLRRLRNLRTPSRRTKPLAGQPTNRSSRKTPHHRPPTTRIRTTT